MAYDVYGGYVDEIGKVIIKDLQKLKKKHEKREKTLTIYRTVLFITAVIFVAYLLIFTVVPYWNLYGLMVSKLINNEVHYILIGILVTVNILVKYGEKKAEKAEKEFHALRCEVIQRVDELWPVGEKRNNRHLFLKEMLEKYNINLYYENG